MREKDQLGEIPLNKLCSLGAVKRSLGNGVLQRTENHKIMIIKPITREKHRRAGGGGERNLLGDWEKHSWRQSLAANNTRPRRERGLNQLERLNFFKEARIKEKVEEEGTGEGGILGISTRTGKAQSSSMYRAETGQGDSRKHINLCKSAGMRSRGKGNGPVEKFNCIKGGGLRKKGRMLEQLVQTGGNAKEPKEHRKHKGSFL